MGPQLTSWTTNGFLYLKVTNPNDPGVSSVQMKLGTGPWQSVSDTVVIGPDEFPGEDTLQVGYQSVPQLGYEAFFGASIEGGTSLPLPRRTLN